MYGTLTFEIMQPLFQGVNPNDLSISKRSSSVQEEVEPQARKRKFLTRMKTGGDDESNIEKRSIDPSDLSQELFLGKRMGLGGSNSLSKLQGDMEDALGLFNVRAPGENYSPSSLHDFDDV